MVDHLTKAQRSQLMGKIKATNTNPERLLRSSLHHRGLRFRLHRRSLPGNPDIVFPGARIAVFVHGCFWHQHTCGRGTMPASRAYFWRAKFERNRVRDQAVTRLLTAMGWTQIVIWECEISSVATRNRGVRRIEGAVKRRTPRKTGQM